MKNTTIIAVVVVLVIVLLVVFVGGRSNDATPTSTPVTSSSVSVAPSASVKPSVVGTPAGTVKPVIPPADLNYNDAIKKYSSSRIQFGQYCNATPNRIVIKSGTSIMLDNRSGDARTISLDATKYTLAGYGFKIVTLTTATTSRTVVIDCGGAQNVAQIIVQK